MSEPAILIFEARLGALRPANPEAEAAMLALSGPVRVKVVGARPNVKRNAFYRAVLAVAAENLGGAVDGGLDPDDLHEILKRKHKFGRTIILPSGEEHFRSQSLAFAKTPEHERATFILKALRTVCQWLGVTPEALLDEAEARYPALGGRLPHDPRPAALPAPAQGA